MDTHEIDKIEQLATIQDAYDTEHHYDLLFEEAMQACEQWHQNHNPNYVRLERNLQEALPVALFKTNDLQIQSDEDMQQFSSSGTSGLQSHIQMDKGTFERIFTAQLSMFGFWNMLDKEEANYLILAPNPQNVSEANYAYTFTKMTACAPIKNLLYGCQEDLKLNVEEIKTALQAWEKEQTPIYIFGLTVLFEHFVLMGLEPLNYRGTLRVITGGGWKGLAQTLSRSEMLEKLEALFPIAKRQVHDLYGMTEHPLHYLSCEHQHFHLPIYSRFQIVLEDGTEAGEGEAGLIRLQNPFSTTMPSHDILTEDIGRWYTKCSCGLSSPYFVLEGRLTSLEATCAYNASS